MSGYKFDVFISYCRRGNVRKWLENHFYQTLVDCLSDQLAAAPTVYVDWAMPRGVHWPSELKKAVRHTKIMVPVFNPPYFESRWCMAEMRSMRERERMLGLRSVEKPQTLLYPILFADSVNFPPESRELSWQDFKEHAHPHPSFQDTVEYLPFHKRVVAFAEDLAELLAQVPEWRPEWPVVDLTEPYLIPPPRMPRFDE
ncbi:hypothetical protein BLA60_10150 [Actinophytocola xinjiangensis]|uniref:TIR domain-containing protein n=1 Tax=Actinophytocola xinjiangensis TaxID=485602 RepID=A0A7Z1AZP9_9PSEU|nr:toll/interleukin-1 receptor domain-containing protein [Actinophytocola xinjiangensis]OLF12323.1 hypothetical protein BLA60_10150 [Actinophytocola xinjiangensis]